MRQVTAIIQARMGSTRLPGKVMCNIVGHPMLWHVIQRVGTAKSIDRILIATTSNREDDVIEVFSKENGLDCFRGNQEDVLDRYYRTAVFFEVETIVRITSDNPFADPGVIDEVISTFSKCKADYVSNTIESTYPLGLNVEIFPFSILERAFKEAKKHYEREHVTPYIWGHPTKFNLVNVRYVRGNLSNLRWTVDTKEDLQFARTIYGKLYGSKRIFLMDDILSLLQKHPKISKINEHIKAKTVMEKIDSGR